MPALKDIEDYLNPADPSIAGLIPVGTTVAGGLLNLNAAGDASQHQAAGVDAATSTVQNAGAQIPGITSSTLDAQKKLLDPYSTAGTGALSQLSSGIADGSLTAPFSYDYNDAMNDPARLFALSEGQKQINAQAGARGIYDSGGTLKRLAEYNADINNQFIDQNYKRSENTFNNNKAQRLSALQQLTGTGLTASGAEASDVGHAGDQNVQGVEWTATQISDLQQQKADALAAGDIGKANAISETLNGIGSQVSGNSALKKILDAIKSNPSIPGVTTAGALQQIQNEALQPTPYGLPNDYPNTNIDFSPVGEAQGNLEQLGALGGVAGVAGLGTLAGAGTAAEVGAAGVLPAAAAASTGGIAGGAAAVAQANAIAAEAGITPEIAGGVVPSATPGTAHAVLSFLGGGGGAALLGVGLGIVAVTALLKSQAHWEASTWVKNFQNPFDQNMRRIQDGVQQAAQSGQLTPDQYAQIRQEAQSAMQQYEQMNQEYSQKGSDYKTVTGQALNTFNQYYGPNGEGYLRQLDQFAGVA